MTDHASESLAKTNTADAIEHTFLAGTTGPGRTVVQFNHCLEILLDDPNLQIYLGCASQRDLLDR